MHPAPTSHSTGSNFSRIAVLPDRTKLRTKLLTHRPSENTPDSPCSHQRGKEKAQLYVKAEFDRSDIKIQWEKMNHITNSTMNYPNYFVYRLSYKIHLNVPSCSTSNFRKTQVSLTIRQIEVRASYMPGKCSTTELETHMSNCQKHELRTISLIRH